MGSGGSFGPGKTMKGTSWFHCWLYVPLTSSASIWWPAPWELSRDWDGSLLINLQSLILLLFLSFSTPNSLFDPSWFFPVAHPCTFTSISFCPFLGFREWHLKTKPAAHERLLSSLTHHFKCTSFFSTFHFFHLICSYLSKLGALCFWGMGVCVSVCV